MTADYNFEYAEKRREAEAVAAAEKAKKSQMNLRSTPINIVAVKTRSLLKTIIFSASVLPWRSSCWMPEGNKKSRYVVFGVPNGKSRFVQILNQNYFEFEKITRFWHTSKKQDCR